VFLFIERTKGDIGAVTFPTPDQQRGLGSLQDEDRRLYYAGHAVVSIAILELECSQEIAALLVVVDVRLETKFLLVADQKIELPLDDLESLQVAGLEVEAYDVPRLRRSRWQGRGI
jgi:hypothetical protein